MTFIIQKRLFGLALWQAFLNYFWFVSGFGIR
jgi:hypothetical protein